MSMKKCAKCDKTVYPIEELKCLDKMWHKMCFRCWSCGMMLNMKNYKGYDKKPYCNAHYPKTTFTAVSETPESKRLAANTRLQSQVKYHEEFEKNIKGTKITVVDDPELLRLKHNTAVISQIEYHGVRDKHADMERKRALVDEDGESIQRRTPGSISDYEPVRSGAAPSPYQARATGKSVVYSTQGKVEQVPAQRKVGSISDFDPVNQNFGSLGTGYNPAGATWQETIPTPRSAPASDSDKRNSQTDHQVFVFDIPAPASPKETSQAGQASHHYPAPQQQQQQQQPRQQQQQQQQQRQQQQPPVQAGPTGDSNPLAGAVFQAMYDYVAQDSDEISFRENDVIINCRPIDKGWMSGTVQSSGQSGWLPANYVERIK